MARCSGPGLDVLPAAGASWAWTTLRERDSRPSGSGSHDDANPDPGALAALLEAAAADPAAGVPQAEAAWWPSLRRLLELGVTISGTGRRETGLERRVRPGPARRGARGARGPTPPACWCVDRSRGARGFDQQLPMSATTSTSAGARPPPGTAPSSSPGDRLPCGGCSPRHPPDLLGRDGTTYQERPGRTVHPAGQLRSPVVALAHGAAVLRHAAADAGVPRHCARWARRWTTPATSSTSTRAPRRDPGRTPRAAGPPGLRRRRTERSTTGPGPAGAVVAAYRPRSGLPGRPGGGATSPGPGRRRAPAGRGPPSTPARAR